MERDDLLAFLRAQRWAVEASVSVHGTPQAAVIGVAVTDDLEIVFDTAEASRKTANLRRNPRAALVVGWDDARTVQLEGLADEPRGAELERLKAAYFARFPDGPERAAREPLTYFRVRPRWVRVSDFTGPEPKVTVVELAPKRAPREPRAVATEVAPPPELPVAPAAADADEAPDTHEALDD
ncbi:MAG TPA: pyridoxamine 5'-phosphate oxidase family protein, partial [Polyangiaceae bacterium]|nr:pyridoxamine 5'-phosphate oxidase family protein [Polyangiaceae bacterium]